MIKTKVIILMCLVFLGISISPTSKASKEYLEAKDYITNTQSGVTTQMNIFLSECHKQGKDAFFNSGTYRLERNLVLMDGVSLLGDSNTVFKGINDSYQVLLMDGSALDFAANITIDNIVFDNVTIFSQNIKSTNWIVSNNIFMNAKWADLTLQTGLNPVGGKNGGENTGYYIAKSNASIEITSNLFFRDSKSLGRGISLYKTENSVISDNYFGLVEDIKDSIVTKKVKDLVNKVNLVGDQGHFMTGINILSGDKNVLIKGNHFSFNTDTIEQNYEDASQNTKGYNRDHIVYAKEYENLQIVANYFKGMPKNQDGGVKCRNGVGLVIYKNIFEDTILMGYVQEGSKVNKFENVFIDSNIFVNKDFSTETFTLTSPTTGQTWTKYYTTDFLFLFINYVNGAVMNNITISNNQFYSFGKNIDINKQKHNEHLRFDFRKFNEATNLTIKNNYNYQGELAEYGLRGIDKPVTKQENFENGVIYQAPIDNSFVQFETKTLLNLYQIPYAIENKKIVCDGEIYLDGVLYDNRDLAENTSYELFILKKSVTKVSIEGNITDLPSHDYTCKIITPKLNIISDIDAQTKKTFELPLIIGDLGTSPIQINDSKQLCQIDGLMITPIKVGTTVLTIRCGGYQAQMNLNISLSTDIEDFTVSDIEKNIMDTAILDLVFDKSKSVDFTYEYNKEAFHINEHTLEITFKLIGEFPLTITEKNSNISKTIIIKIFRNTLKYETAKTNYLVGERFDLKVFINDVLSDNYIVEGLEFENGKYYAQTINSAIKIIEKQDKENYIVMALTFKHSYLLEVPSTITLVMGESVKLDIKMETTDTQATLVYEYDNSFVSIDNGMLKALKSGMTIIKIGISGSNEFTDLPVKINKKIETKAPNYSIIITSVLGVGGIGILTFVLLKRRKKSN